MTDIHSSDDDYDVYNYVADSLILKSEFKAAEPYVQKSISLYPRAFNYLNLAIILTHEGNYMKAWMEYNNSPKDGVTVTNVEAVGEFTLLYGNYYYNLFLSNALKLYPTDFTLWQDLALLYEEYSYTTKAQTAIAKASTYGSVNPTTYSGILNNQSFLVKVEGHNLQFKN
jgi:hypothetical protein